MKAIKLIASISLVSFCLSNTKPVNANPAVLAPAAFCAGTAGVGCALVGVATVGGIVYYVWKSGNGRKIYSTKKGQVFKIEDPESFETEQVIATFSARGQKEAMSKCKFIAKDSGKKYVEVRPTSRGWQCVVK